MASYHCTAKVVSRARGQSAIAKAAYNARDRLVDEQTGEVKNYTRKAEQVLFSAIFAPKDAPEWAHDREELWNRAERAETRKNSQLAREIEIALPHELTHQQREWLLKDFVRENFTRGNIGMVADVNMHAPDKDGDERNYHAHILLTTRRLDGEGFTADKAREWNDRALYSEWRADLAEKGAKMLERAGFDIEAERWRYGHLENAAQLEKALERGDLAFAELKAQEPTRHQGPQIQDIEARGVVSEVQERRGIEAANDNAIRDELAELRAERAAIDVEIAREEGRTPGRQVVAPRGRGIEQLEAAGGKVAAAVLNMAEKVTEGALGLFAAFGESTPSRELIGARIADREQKQEHAREAAEWQRYVSDEDYRRELAAREQSDREQRAQDFTRQKDDRDRDR